MQEISFVISMKVLRKSSFIPILCKHRQAEVHAINVYTQAMLGQTR